MSRLDDTSASEDEDRQRPVKGGLRAFVRRGAMDHIYGRWLLKFGADALLAAAAFALAFNLRFLDAGGVPERYWAMLTGTIVFVALGKAVVFSLLGLNQKWWRYFQLPDLWPIIRAAAVTSGLLVAVFTLAKPYAYNLPRSVVVLDFLLTIVLVGGAALVSTTATTLVTMTARVMVEVCSTTASHCCRGTLVSRSSRVRSHTRTPTALPGRRG